MDGALLEQKLRAYHDVGLPDPGEAMEESEARTRAIPRRWCVIY
jgi:hypothetical protein